MTPSNPDSAARTYDLVLAHLTHDGAAVDASAEPKSRAAVPETELFEILNRIVQIPPVQAVELEPQITIRGRQTNVVVRPDRGRLLVCELATSDRLWREMTPAEAQSALQGASTVTIATKPEEPAEAPKPIRTRRWPIALLFAGLALNGYVLFEVFLVRLKPEFLPADGGRPTKELLESISGSYTAANPPTTFSRIELRPPNAIVFHDAQTGRTEGDTYLVGSYNGKPRLLTGQNGFIDLPDRRTIEFAGRRYEREPARP